MKGKQDMKKNIMLVLSVALLLVSCEDKFLDRKPHGGTIRQDQYENIDEKVEGTVRGLYTRLYTMSGGHDEFGKRSIDLWGDILSGDIAVTNPNYGWLVSDEQMQTVSTRTGATAPSIAQTSLSKSAFKTIVCWCIWKMVCLQRTKSTSIPTRKQKGHCTMHRFWLSAVTAMRNWPSGTLLWRAAVI